MHTYLSLMHGLNVRKRKRLSSSVARGTHVTITQVSGNHVFYFGPAAPFLIMTARATITSPSPWGKYRRGGQGCAVSYRQSLLPIQLNWSAIGPSFVFSADDIAIINTSLPARQCGRSFCSPSASTNNDSKYLCGSSLRSVKSGA